MSRKTTLKAGCALFAVFTAGLLCGAVVLFLFLIWIIPLSEGWGDEKSKAFVARHIANQIDLDETQFEAVRPIVNEVLEQRFERRKTYVEEDIALAEKGFERVLPLLREDQVDHAHVVFERWKRGKERFLKPRSN